MKSEKRSKLASLFLAVVIAPPMATAQDISNEKQMMIDKGLQHETAWALYQALKEEADGGQRLEWSNVPDWSGELYARTDGTSGGTARFNPLFDMDL